MRGEMRGGPRGERRVKGGDKEREGGGEVEGGACDML